MEVKMKKVEFSVSTGMVGSRIRETVEIEDYATDEDIEEIFKEWMWEKIDAYWKVVSGGKEAK